MLSTIDEFVSFIILLGSLFVITGGIFISAKLSGSARTNTFLLIVGSLLASVIGTTGASMLLVRPLLTALKRRLVGGSL